MDHSANYKLLNAQLAAITDGIPYETANLANAAALLWEHLPDINWAGFYKLISMPAKVDTHWKVDTGI